MRMQSAAMVIALTVVMIAAIQVAATAQPREEMPRVTIRVTDQGINISPEERVGGQNYLVTIVNDTATRRGVQMTGIDRGVSRFVRFTRVVGPGQSETFRWYFPAGRTFTVQDLLRCDHGMRTCMAFELGGHRSSFTIV